MEAHLKWQALTVCSQFSNDLHKLTPTGTRSAHLVGFRLIKTNKLSTEAIFNLEAVVSPEVVKILGKEL